MTEQDIVERLRDAYADSSQRILGSRIFVEAAAEIERLRTRVEKTEALLIKARNDALEEASQIADKHESSANASFNEVIRRHHKGERNLELAAATAAGMDHTGRHIANAIRALKEKQA